MSNYISAPVDEHLPQTSAPSAPLPGGQAPTVVGRPRNRLIFVLSILLILGALFETYAAMGIINLLGTVNFNPTGIVYAVLVLTAVSAVYFLLLGVLGIANSANPDFADYLFLMGLGLCLIALFNFILILVEHGQLIFGIAGFVLPVLFVIGSRNLKGRASGPIDQWVANHKTAAAWAFMTPMILGVCVFFVYPLVMTVYYSFNSFNILGSPKWIGLANWKYLFGSDPLVKKAALNTLWFVCIMVPVRVVGAMVVASVLTRARRASGLFRTLFYMPALIPPVASTIAFVYVFNPSSGPINAALDKISAALGHIGLHISLHPGWFTNASWAKPSLTLLGLWAVGDIMVIFLASLLDVPQEQYEAAELDGAGSWSQFRFVTLPAMQPVILFSAVTGIIGALQYFTEPTVASAVAQGKSTVGGGMSGTLGWPGQSTLTYGQWLYSQAFGYGRMGYASALAVLMFVVSAIIIFLLLRRFSEFSPEVAS